MNAPGKSAAPSDPNDSKTSLSFSETEEGTPARLPLNILGVIAIVVLGIYTCYSFLQPFFYRFASADNIELVGIVSVGFLLVGTLVTIGFGLAGALSRRETRGRWLAWVAVGGASAFLLSGLLAAFGNWIAYSLIP